MYVFNGICVYVTLMAQINGLLYSGFVQAVLSVASPELLAFEPEIRRIRSVYSRYPTGVFRRG